jgi:asparagine synthase (glutamine-hydrolysing)
MARLFPRGAAIVAYWLQRAEMCGIAGYLEPHAVATRAAVEVMCNQIAHRGPDDAGYLADGECAIGMRRLSIIDLAGGHQPISNEDGSVWVVFNGEIYNYRELRTLLAGRGHRFTTNSDTEVLVHLYEDEGPAGVARLRGMFAYAIWDARQRRVLLARDRFGKKPLYYSLVGGNLYFGSELKCLRAADVPLETDNEALRLYFQFGYIPDPLSPYKAIKKLPAGTWMTFASTGEVQHGRYWKLPAPALEPPPGLTEAAAREKLIELVDESVRIRLIADVPLGAFLSGGVDSSIVVSSMARQTAEPVKTFSIGFRESAFNELEHAREIARLYATEHHEIIVEPDSAGLLEKLVAHFDEPFADTAAIPTLIMSQFAVKSVKVALTGDGGDELFGGYSSMLAVTGLLQKMDAIPGPARKLMRWLAETLPYSAYGKNFLRVAGSGSVFQRYFESNYAPWSMRRALLRDQWMLPAEEGFLAATLSDYFLSENSDPVSQVMYWEATANLTGDMLVKVDRMSMAASLEVRSPLLDHKLAEFAMQLPHAWKVRGGRGKAILIDAFQDRFPPGFLQRKKAGFVVPLADWFRGPLRPLLEDGLNGREFLARGVVSPGFMRYLTDEHQRGRRDNSYYLWMLLVLDMWFRQSETRLTVAPTPAPHPHSGFANVSG